MLDLEYRFKALQEEKLRVERDAQEREEVLKNKGLVLQTEIRRISDAVTDKQTRLKEADTELNTYKNLVMDKDVELSKLQKELVASNDENALLTKDGKLLEGDLNVLIDGRRRAEMELIRLKDANSAAIKSHDITNAKEHDSTIELENFRRKLLSLENELSVVQNDQSRKLSSLDVAKDKQRATQLDLNRLFDINEKLKNENNGLIVHIGNLERDLSVVRQRFEDTSVVLESKEKELLSLRSGIAYAEDKSAEISSELARINNENDKLKVITDKYRDDAEFQKRLRDEEAHQKLLLEEEKRRLEQEAVNKEMEARNVKKELAQIQFTSGKLRDDHEQLNQELEALKQHATLLESHNYNVRIIGNYS